MQKKMIYHAPYPLDTDSVSGSAIRPRQMRKAFEELGYRVFEVSGYATERRGRIRAIEQRLRQGEQFDFLYSENSTIPFVITEKKHLPPHPFLDVRLFRACHKYGVPCGVFYRDLYWAFEDYVERVGRLLASVMRPIYQYELLIYRRYMKRIFVPSKEMTKYARLLRNWPTVDLPPGGVADCATSQKQQLTLLYVGGIGVHYQLDYLVQAVKQLSQVKLYICCDKARWEANSQALAVAGYDNIVPVHLQGDELAQLYRKVDVGALALEASHYWTFAQPLKFYEYIGRGKPILSTAGMYISKYVADKGIGWVVPYQVEAIKAQLQELLEKPELLKVAQEKVRQVQADNTWQARARTVAQQLQGE